MNLVINGLIGKSNMYGKFLYMYYEIVIRKIILIKIAHKIYNNNIFNLRGERNRQ